MAEPNLKDHWNQAWSTNDSTKVSWFQESPAPSLELIERHASDTACSLVDIGGGASTLVDALLDRGYEDLTVLDLARASLEIAKNRLGERASRVTWIESNVLDWQPDHQFDVWHDRAAFHFLTEKAQQDRYKEILDRNLKLGGLLILGTFAPDGPEKCSGLPVCRHDSASLSTVLGNGYELVEALSQDHVTPAGRVQHFNFSVFRQNV